VAQDPLWSGRRSFFLLSALAEVEVDMSPPSSFLAKNLIPTLALTLGLATAGCGARSSGDASETDASPNASAAALTSVKIGEFNMLRLGQNGVEKNLDRLADIIKKADFHIFAGTEIMTEEGAEEVLAALQERTGKPWKLLLSKTASGESAYKEYLGYYYRSDLVKAQAPTQNFCATSEGKQRIESACFAKDHYDNDGYADFDRDPFVGHFKVGSSYFSLVAVHLYYGDTGPEATARRLGELAQLRKVMDRVRQSTPSSDVIGMGDYNFALPTFEFEDATDANPSLSAAEANAQMPPEFFNAAPALAGLIDGPTTVGFSSYDHILYYQDNQHQPIEGTEKIVTDFNLSNSAARQEYKAEVSDHYAIGVDFSLID
jgi:hypothetical protein